MTDIKITRAHCNTCSGEKKHAVLHSVYRQWVECDEYDNPIHCETTTYDMVQCCGCDEIKLKVLSTGPWPDSPPIYFPAAMFRRQPEWMLTLMRNSFAGGVYKTLFDLLSEVYKALQNGMPRLAAMGIRAALESIMLDKVGDQGTFKQNVSAFALEGHIAANQSLRITSVLDAGSAVIHRGYEPSTEDVLAMVNLTENLVESIYFHPNQIDGVAGRIPLRGSIKKSS